MATTTVFIDGDQGTTGLQIHARLRERDDIRLLTLPDAVRKDPQQRQQAFRSSDIAILCLPDDAARQAMALIGQSGVRVIDASSAHRTDPAWVYGFPEMAPEQAARIAQAQWVTNPGCYPTGAIGLLRPLVQAGMVAPDYPLAIHAVSGYSGGGRAAVERHESGAAGSAADFLVYGLGLTHKHVPEIQTHALLAQRPAFLPAYGAFRQGIVLTIALQQRLLPAGVDAVMLHEALARHYAGVQDVAVLSRQEAAGLAQLDPQACNDTNRMQLGVFDNGPLGQILLTAVFDNLGKGAAGAAVQNLDLMLG